MAAVHDRTIASEIIQQFGAKPELLVQILRAFADRYGFISAEVVRQVAEEVNLSRAEVHGVVSFYHDFRTTPPGDHVLRICQAESCQAMGCRALTSRAEESLGVGMHETTEDGRITLEPVYCLGNCACSPAVMVDDRVYGRVDADKLESLIDGCRGAER